MANFQWSEKVLSYTPTATTQLTDYEVAKLPVLDSHPYLRSYRTNNVLTQTDIDCSFGSSKTLLGIGIWNLNVSTIQLAKSTNNGSTYVDLFTGSGTLSNITVSKHWAFYRYFSALASVAATNIRLRLPAQTPVDGAAYLEVGSLQFFTALNTLPWNPGTPLRETLLREYEVSGNDKAPVTPPYLSQEWPMILETINVQQVRDIALLGEHTPFVLFENRGLSQECYLMRTDGAISFERNGTYQRMNPHLMELV